MIPIVIAVVCLSLSVLAVTFFGVIRPYIAMKIEQHKAEDKDLNEKVARCACCKNCKMLYDDGYVVCDKMDFKQPQPVPERCYKKEMKGIPDIPFDEIDEIETDITDDI